MSVRPKLNSGCFMKPSMWSDAVLPHDDNI